MTKGVDQAALPQSHAPEAIFNRTSLQQPPPLGRRIAALLYESVLLFGVLMTAGLLYGVVTQQRHGLSGRTGLQLMVLATLALYFTWFWTHGGQTLAMRSWKMRVVDTQGAPLSAPRALLRFALAWLWVAPPIIAGQWIQPLLPGTLYALMGAWFTIYLTASYIRSDRQFVHDAICGTRLIDVRAPKPDA